ncbi:MAG TPA: hypothetical protein VF152_14980 [Acidimicrobiia bacterium]
MVALAVASCDDGDPGTRSHDAEVYAAVIRALAPDPPGAPVEELDRTVFVGPADDEVDISIGVQASVVDDLEEFATIRFVDDEEEAIGDDELETVINDGVLVLLGPVPPGTPTTVRARRYVDADDMDRYRVTVEGSGENWEVADLERVTG